jgi:hypothetical protein
MPHAFLCRTCGVDLSDFLLETSNLLKRDAAMVHRGFFVRVHETISKQDLLAVKFLDGKGEMVMVQPGDFLLNVEDLRHEMLPSAYFGCCGYQGGPEANAVCPNGHPVATIHSDCWHASVARLIGSAVECVALD